MDSYLAVYGTRYSINAMLYYYVPSMAPGTPPLYNTNRRSGRIRRARGQHMARRRRVVVVVVVALSLTPATASTYGSLFASVQPGYKIYSLPPICLYIDFRRRWMTHPRPSNATLKAPTTSHGTPYYKSPTTLRRCFEYLLQTVKHASPTNIINKLYCLELKAIKGLYPPIPPPLLLFRLLLLLLLLLGWTVNWTALVLLAVFPKRELRA